MNGPIRDPKLDRVVIVAKKVDRLHEAVVGAAFSDKIKRAQARTTQCGDTLEFDKRLQEYWYALSEEIFRRLPPEVKESL